MWQGNELRRACAIALLLAGIAHADDEPRSGLAAQLAAERTVIEMTRATVGDKLRAVDLVRTARLRAAYRLLRPLSRTPLRRDGMADARRRAAARFLVARDRAERALLADELGQLAAANERTIRAASALPAIRLPETIALPAAGTIARRFGTIAHERSKTTLARRGIDLEVTAKTDATAPAAGKVRYAGPIRGLDLGVIVDHGDYLTVVAKLGELAVPTGMTLAAGDRVGRAARHRIYLEVRVKLGASGIPIDPEPLLAAPENKSR